MFFLIISAIFFRYLTPISEYSIKFWLLDNSYPIFFSNFFILNFLSKKEAFFSFSLTYLSNHKLSPFEQIICCALIFFDFKKVDLLILEAGLWWILDATTAHPLRPIIAIGNIGLDHKEYLGDSLEKIAKEKVAVIEKNAFVISCRQEAEVEEIIKARVKQVNAKIIWKESLSNDYEIGLNGNFQKQNAAVAIGVIEELINFGFKVKERSIKEGLKNTKWSGRLEIINCFNKKILVDSAHNYSAAKALQRKGKLGIIIRKGFIGF